MYAARYSKSPAVVTALVKGKANVDATDDVRHWENNIFVGLWEATLVPFYP